MKKPSGNVARMTNDKKKKEFEDVIALTVMYFYLHNTKKMFPPLLFLHTRYTQDNYTSISIRVVHISGFTDCAALSIRHVDNTNVSM